jgi:hypothetical protein
MTLTPPPPRFWGDFVVVTCPDLQECSTAEKIKWTAAAATLGKSASPRSPLEIGK